VSVVPVVRPVRAVAAAGLLAGTLDLLAAFVIYGPLGVSPVRILDSIASGLLGRAAFQGGASAAALGFVLQFVIATTAAIVYYVASLRLPMLVRRPVVWGSLYGVVVYVVMNFIVVPLSAVPRGPFNWSLAPVIVLVHMVCVGVPIAWVLASSRASAG
jgi:hypothetical protein